MFVSSDLNTSYAAFVAAIATYIVPNGQHTAAAAILAKDFQLVAEKLARLGA